MAGVGPQRKGLLLICDGLGDRPVDALGGATPLEAAKTPVLDALAAAGACGLMYPIAPGIVAGSDTSHLSILGYNPRQYYTGRGPFECAGIDMEVLEGDVCFRVNFATLWERHEAYPDPIYDAEAGTLTAVVRDRRAGRIEGGTDQLAAAINGIEIDGVQVLFKESVAHRAGLILRGKGLGHLVSDVDPHKNNEPLWVAKGEDEPSERTAIVLNKFVARSYQVFRDMPVNRKRVEKGELPANVALPRGVGTAPSIPGFDAANHVKSACIVETGLIRGIGRYSGMTVIDVPTATGGLDSDLDAMARAVVEALATHSFVLCNMKGPDIAGHNGDADAKVKIIERIDSAVKVIVDAGMDDLVIAVTGDHSTPIERGEHGGDAVPFILAGPGVRPDTVVAFGEGPCAAGALGTFSGAAVMPMMTNLMNVQPKYGA